MEKKNPYVTTIGFNKDDSDHVRVAKMLNAIGRGKAQYIVKAVLVYQELQKKGEFSQTTLIPYDYDGIKRIVLQIMEEREKLTGNFSSISNEVTSEVMKQNEMDLLQKFDEDAMSNIMASIAAFREQ